MGHTKKIFKKSKVKLVKAKKTNPFLSLRQSCKNTGFAGSARRATSASSFTPTTCPRCRSATSTLDTVSHFILCIINLIHGMALFSGKMHDSSN